MAITKQEFEEKYGILKAFVLKENQSRSMFDDLWDLIEAERVEGLDVSKVTRVDLIDHTKDAMEGGGRIVARRNVVVDLSVQDLGRTLKIFITNKK